MPLRGACICINFLEWSVTSGAFRSGVQSTSVFHPLGSKTMEYRGSGVFKSPYRWDPSSLFNIGSNTMFRQRLGCRQESVSDVPIPSPSTLTSKSRYVLAICWCEVFEAAASNCRITPAMPPQTVTHFGRRSCPQCTQAREEAFFQHLYIQKPACLRDLLV
jgi:hypothetical protein